MKNFKNLKQKYIQKYIFWKTKKNLLRDLLLDHEKDKIMEGYVTKAIIELKHEGRRQELVNLQKRIKAREPMIKYIKNL